MNRSTSHSSGFGTNVGESIGAATTAALKQLLAVVRRQKAVLAACLAITYALGIFYYFAKEPIYEAKASVLVHRNDDALSGKSGAVETGQPDYLPTHVRLMKSSAVLERALSKMQSSTQPAPSHLTPEDLAKTLKVSAQQETEIIDIAYQTTDAPIAAAVVEAVVASYLEFVNETHHTSSKEILQILSQRQSDVDGELREKERQLADLQKSVGLMALRDEKSNVVVARVTALNQALTQARTRRLEVEASHRAVKEAMARGESIEPYLLRHLDRLGSDAVAQKLGLRPKDASAVAETARRELLRDQLELKRLEPIYLPNHPKLQMLQERIRIAEQALEPEQETTIPKGDLTTLALQMIEHDLRETRILEADLQKQFDKEQAQALELNARNSELNALEAEIKRHHTFYDTVTQRIKELDLGDQHGAITTHVIEPPQEPKNPIAPTAQKVTWACTALGLFVGLALCYLFEWWDTSYRGAEEIAHHLNMPVLGQIPRIAARRGSEPFELVMQYAPHSAEAEAFRTLRAALMLCDVPPKKFAVTSPQSGDGKTSIVTNLAVAFAQSGLRTLVVDADMRRPRLSQLFEVSDQPGLSALLQQEDLAPEYLIETVHPTFKDKLDIMPAGTVAAPLKGAPTELLAAENLEKLVAWAETHYDRVIFDTPPILAVSDSAVLSRMLDGTLLVLRTGKSNRAATKRACDALERLNCVVTGIVVNGVGPSENYDYAYYGNAESGYRFEPDAESRRAGTADDASFMNNGASSETAS